jgi:hypothetical protein
MYHVITKSHVVGLETVVTSNPRNGDMTGTKCKSGMPRVAKCSIGPGKLKSHKSLTVTLRDAKTSDAGADPSDVDTEVEVE